MKPGRQDHTVVLVTANEMADLSEALIDFSDSWKAVFLDKKLDGAIPPLELDPDESALALYVLRAAARHSLTNNTMRSRLSNMLGQYDNPA